MAAESTAVNALIHLVQARRLDPDEDPVPDLFSTTPPKSIAQRTIGMPADPRPMAPAVVPPAPPRVASGTKPPPIADAKTIVPIQQAAPSKPAVVEQDDEQTALWDSNAQVETAPHSADLAEGGYHVPAIAPHIATVIAHPGPAVPSILRGPVAPAPDPRVMQAARAAHAAAQRHAAEPVSPRHARPATDPRVDAAAAARAAQQRLPAAAHPVALSPQYPAIAYAAGGSSIHVSNPHLPHVPRTPTAAPAPYLVARELMTSAVRSWGTLVAVCVLALGVGVYLAIASKSDDKPEAPTDRDRAIAIMNGTAEPEPETVVEAPAPTEVTTAYKPLEESSAAKPTAEPIEDEAAEEEATDEASDEIDIAAIEIETDTPTARPAKKRAARSARAARKAKSIATKEIEKPTRGDPVLAILAEKPKAASKPEKNKEVPKKAKPVKEASLANATEIAAARGAAPTKGTGKIAISSDKPALIFVDGRPTGKSAPSAFVVPAGDHQITLLDPATKKAKTATVQIAANKTVSVRKDFN